MKKKSKCHDTRLNERFLRTAIGRLPEGGPRLNGEEVSFGEEKGSHEDGGEAT